MRNGLRFLILLCSGMLVKCASDLPYPQQVVRSQASYDFDCASKEISVSPLGGHRYLADGCFKREVYLCHEGWFVFQSSIECHQVVPER